MVAISSELSYYITRSKRIRDTHFYYHRNRNVKKIILEEQLLDKIGKGIPASSTIELIVAETGSETGVRKTVRSSPHSFRHYWTVKIIKTREDFYCPSLISS